MSQFNSTQVADSKPGPYYVTAQDGSHYWLMRGPFDSHQQALDLVGETMSKAVSLDPRAQWKAWGTSRLPADLVRADPGKMNKYFDANA
jgi:hypothetical protein